MLIGISIIITLTASIGSHWYFWQRVFTIATWPCEAASDSKLWQATCAWQRCTHMTGWITHPANRYVRLKNIMYTWTVNNKNDSTGCTSTCLHMCDCVNMRESFNNKNTITVICPHRAQRCSRASSLHGHCNSFGLGGRAYWSSPGSGTCQFLLTS